MLVFWGVTGFASLSTEVTFSACFSPEFIVHVPLAAGTIPSQENRPIKFKFSSKLTWHHSWFYFWSGNRPPGPWHRFFVTGNFEKKKTPSTQKILAPATKNSSHSPTPQTPISHDLVGTGNHKHTRSFLLQQIWWIEKVRNPRNRFWWEIHPKKIKAKGWNPKVMEVWFRWFSGFQLGMIFKGSRRQFSRE